MKRFAFLRFIHLLDTALNIYDYVSANFVISRPADLYKGNIITIKILIIIGMLFGILLLCLLNIRLIITCYSYVLIILYNITSYVRNQTKTLIIIIYASPVLKVRW